MLKIPPKLEAITHNYLAMMMIQTPKKSSQVLPFACFIFQDGTKNVYLESTLRVNSNRKHPFVDVHTDFKNQQELVIGDEGSFGQVLGDIASINKT